MNVETPVGDKESPLLSVKVVDPVCGVQVVSA